MPAWISPQEEGLALQSLKRRVELGLEPWARAKQVRPLGIEPARSTRILEALFAQGRVDRRARTVKERGGGSLIIVEYRISSSGSA